MESFCLPILLYSVASFKLSRIQISEYNTCLNSVCRRIFCFNKCESVKSFIAGLGRLDFYSVGDLLYLKFCKQGLISKYNLFRSIMQRHGLGNECNIILSQLELLNLSVVGLVRMRR